jgi:diguanylate cyclase (GGDEF)-like protein
VTSTDGLLMKFPLTSRSRRMPLTASFAIASFILTLALGLVLSAVIQRTITDRAITALEKNTTSGVGLTSRLIVDTAFPGDDGVASLTDVVAQVRLTAAATQVFLQSRDAVSIVAVLPNGFVLGGAGGLGLGAKFPIDSAFEAGLRGTTVTRILRRSQLASATPLEQKLLLTNGDLLLYQLSVRAKPGSKVLAIVRDYAALAPVQAQARADVRRVVGILALGLLIFWGVLARMIFGASRALTRQSKANAHLATHDALTGLPNRALLRDRSEYAITSARRSGAHVALILLDLDGFKEINDTLGHVFGDKLLIQVGLRLTAELREADTVSRLGGDEFVVLLASLPHSAPAVMVAENLAARLQEDFLIDGVTVNVGCSLGVATTPDDADDFDALLQHADVAMYAAKSEGLGVVSYAAALDAHGPSRLTLLGELRRALDDPRQIVLHYQPKADLHTGAISGVEALARWQHPTRGLLPPAEFIPLAERTGIIRALTWRILRQALEQNRQWATDGLVLQVAVNMSARCLLDANFAAEVMRLLAETGVPPERLGLELTESAVMTDPERGILVLQALHDHGIRLSIDDFGTGYSSMAYLKKLPVDELKIDRAFVTGMAQDPSDAAIVRSSLELARNLNLQVVAEGVETAEVWRQLTDLGCASAQGYFLSRPLSAADFTKWHYTHQRVGIVAEGVGVV